MTIVPPDFGETFDDSMTLVDIIKQCLCDSEAWFPMQAGEPPFLMLCLVGEVGEAANHLKKVERGSHEYRNIREAYCEELVDVFIYLMNLVGIAGIDLVAAYKKKRNFNVQRFGEVAGVTFVPRSSDGDDPELIEINRREFNNGGK